MQPFQCRIIPPPPKTDSYNMSFLVLIDKINKALLCESWHIFPPLKQYSMCITELQHAYYQVHFFIIWHLDIIAITLFTTEMISYLVIYWSPISQETINPPMNYTSLLVSGP